MYLYLCMYKNENRLHFFHSDFDATFHRLVIILDALFFSFLFIFFYSSGYVRSVVTHPYSTTLQCCT